MHNIFFWKEFNTGLNMHASMLCAFSFQNARISCFGNQACCHRINMTALTARYLRRLSALCVRSPTDSKHCHLFSLTPVPAHYHPLYQRLTSSNINTYRVLERLKIRDAWKTQASLEDNINTNIKEIELEGVEWINMAQIKYRWPAVKKEAMNFPVL